MWVQFQGLPAAGTGYLSVDCFVRVNDATYLVGFFGLDAAHQSKRLLPGLLAGEAYRLAVYGRPTAMSSGSGSGSGSYGIDLAAAVPDPASWAMLLGGLSLLAGGARQAGPSVVPA